MIIEKLSEENKLLKERIKPLEEKIARLDSSEPDVEPTNNGTDRRITQGARGDAGKRWCEHIRPTIAICKKQQCNVFDFIHEAVIAYWNHKKHPSLICQKP